MAAVEVSKQIINILDAKYNKVYLWAVVENDFKHLNVHNRALLLEVLIEFEELYK